jgi:lysophospholipase L1-like esterase
MTKLILRGIRVATAAVVVLVVLLGARAHAAPIKVAGVGDSITQLSQWPQKLGTLLGANYTSTNYGVSGTTLLKKGDAPYWNTTAFTQSHTDNPDIVVIMLGTNDSKPFNWNAHKGDFVGDYEALIDSYTALPRHPKVYLNLCPPAGANGYQIDGTVIANEILPLIKQVAIAKGVPTIDVYDAFGGANLDTSLYGGNGDLVHPNDKGGMVIAETVYAALTAPASDGGADGAPLPDGATDGDTSGGSLDASGVAPPDASNGADAGTTPDATSTGGGGAAAGSGGAAAGSGGASTGAGGAVGGAGGAAGGAVAPASKSSGGCAIAGDPARAPALGVVAFAFAFALARRRRVR